MTDDTGGNAVWGTETTGAIPNPDTAFTMTTNPRNLLDMIDPSKRHRYEKYLPTSGQDQNATAPDTRPPPAAPASPREPHVKETTGAFGRSAPSAPSLAKVRASGMKLTINGLRPAFSRYAVDKGNESDYVPDSEPLRAEQDEFPYQPAGTAEPSKDATSSPSKKISRLISPEPDPEPTSGDIAPDSLAQEEEEEEEEVFEDLNKQSPVKSKAGSFRALEEEEEEDVPLAAVIPARGRTKVLATPKGKGKGKAKVESDAEDSEQENTNHKVTFRLSVLVSFFLIKLFELFPE